MGRFLCRALVAKPAFYTVVSRESAVKLPRSGGQALLTLDFERTNEKFKDVPLTVLPLGLPAGVAAAVKRNGNGPKETYDIVLKGTKDLAEGEHLFRYFAYAELAGAGTRRLVGRHPIEGDRAETAAPPAEAKKPAEVKPPRKLRRLNTWGRHSCLPEAKRICEPSRSSSPGLRRIALRCPRGRTEARTDSRGRACPPGSLSARNQALGPAQPNAARRDRPLCRRQSARPDAGQPVCQHGD